MFKSVFIFFIEGTYICSRNVLIRIIKRSYLKGDIAEIHDADTHVLQHGQLLSWEHSMVNSDNLYLLVKETCL